MKLKIRQVRKEKGFTIRRLAKEAEISIGYLSELESCLGGKMNPSLTVI